jgi:methanogenic corrinoid protein MtbC1
MNTQDLLLKHIADLNEEAALDVIRRRLAAGHDAYHILRICQEGVRLVGRRYEEGIYFIAGLIMGGEILRSAVEMIKPKMEDISAGKELGTIVLGTVQGDIHDIGKNLVGTLLSCQGFQVIDLGIDVEPDLFVTAVAKYRPKVLGLSCLLTSAVESMKYAVEAVNDAGFHPEVPIIIGGSMLDDDVRTYTGADYWTNDAMEGVNWCVRVAEQIDSGFIIDRTAR